MDEKDFKKELKLAVDAFLDQQKCLFAVGSDVMGKTGSIMKQIHFQGLDSLQVPLTIENVKKVAHHRAVYRYGGDEHAIGSCNYNYSDSNKNNRNFLIPANHLIQEEDNSSFFRSTVPTLACKALTIMGINMATEVLEKPILDHVIVQGPGASLNSLCKAPINRENKWKMVIQVPIEGGHEGGRLKVELGSRICLFATSPPSAALCHVTVFDSDCAHQFEEVTFGWRLALIFHLSSKTFEIPSPLPASPNLPRFFTIQHFRNIVGHWPTESLRLLAFPLEHCYALPLKFAALKGRDRALIQLFRSVDFLDLHLSQITLKEVGLATLPDADVDDEEDIDIFHHSFLSKNEECSCCESTQCKCFFKNMERYLIETVSDFDFETSSWTDLEDKPVSTLHLKVDVKSEVLCRDKNELFTRRIAKPEKKKIEGNEDFQAILGSGSLLQMSLSRSFIVVWPKSFNFMLKYNFPAVLDRLNEAHVFPRVVEFCQNHPELVWQGKSDNGAITLRLINHCIASGNSMPDLLKLQLLDAVASDFPSAPADRIDPSQFEGVRSCEVAAAIAQLAAHFSWDTVLAVISKFFSAPRIQLQLENVIHLSVYLLNAGCTEGALETCNWIACVINQIGSNSSDIFQNSSLVAYVGLRFRMRETEDGAGLMLDDLPAFLNTLSIQSFFDILKEVEESYTELLRQSTPCRQFQRDCLRALAAIDFSNSPGEFVVEVLLFLVKIDDCTILKQFVDSSSLESHLETLVSSADVWNECLVSFNGEKTLGQIVEKRINQLNSAPHPVFSWSQPACSLPETAIDLVLEFLRGNEAQVELTCTSWKIRSHVQKFINSNFGDEIVFKMLMRGFSVEFVYNCSLLSTREISGFSLTVIKTRHYFENVVMAQYLELKQEIRFLENDANGALSGRKPARLLRRRPKRFLL